MKKILSISILLLTFILFCFANSRLNQVKAPVEIEYQDLFNYYAFTNNFSLLEDKTYLDTDLKLYLINPNHYLLPSSKSRTQASKEIIRNIKNSKVSIDFAIYGYESQPEILNALIDAKSRGVKIKAIVDSNPKRKDVYHQTNLIRKHFEYKNDNHTAIMHNKFFIFDKKTVMTGSMNISSTGSGGYNSNICALIDDKKVADIYTKEFEQMFKGKFKREKSCHKLIDHRLKNSGIISIYFAPSCDILTPILDEIKNAKNEILVSAFYLTQRDVIEELSKKSKEGVRVFLLIDSLAAWNFKNRLEKLKENEVKIRHENFSGKNHQKVILIDNKTIIFGSANFSKSAVIKNDENLVILKNPVVGMLYKSHFFNMYNSVIKKYTDTIPRAEGLESKNSCYDRIDNNFNKNIDYFENSCNNLML